MEVVSFTPRPLYIQGKNPWHLLARRLGGPLSRSRRGGREKIPPHREPNPRTSIVQPVASRDTPRGPKVRGCTDSHSLFKYQDCQCPRVVKLLYARVRAVNNANKDQS